MSRITRGLAYREVVRESTTPAPWIAAAPNALSSMRIVLADEVFMQRIGRDAGGVPQLKNESIRDFLASMAGLPDTLLIQERLLDYRIRVDGDMAHAWTPYEFYVQGKFHHCGVNSFQLFHDGKSWRIIYLVDTRRTGDCAQ